MLLMYFNYLPDTVIHSGFHNNTTVEGTLIERVSERQKSELQRVRMSKVFLG
jgi:hypothetical protein